MIETYEQGSFDRGEVALMFGASESCGELVHAADQIPIIRTKGRDAKPGLTEIDTIPCEPYFLARAFANRIFPYARTDRRQSLFNMGPSSQSFG